MDKDHKNGPVESSPIVSTISKPHPKTAVEGRTGDFHHAEDDWSSNKVLFNLLVVSSAFFLVFTAFMGLSNLQSSINCDQGLGVASLATIYATLIFSALFIPSFVIKHIGIKYTLVAAMCCYTLYSAANFYPSWYTLIPASVILGLAGAPLWSSKCTYLTTIGMRYAVIHNEKREVIVSRFFGIFFLFFQASQVLGNLISSLVFSVNETNATSTDFTCGSMYCYSDGGDDANATSICEATKPPKHLTNIVIGIYTACGACAVCIILFGLTPIQPSEKNQSSSTFELVGATIRLMMDKRLLLLIPITMVSGLEQAYMQGDFTKSFVTCKIGVQWVGYVMICYGVVDASSSYLSGRVEKWTGRIPQFSMAALINIALMIAMTFWKPTEDLPVYFVIAAFWGLADAVWQTQLNAYYGVLFPFNQEPAFSNYRLWESAGYTLSFAYSNFLCTWTKMLILSCFIGVGMSGYFVTEFQRQNAPTQKEQNGSNFPVKNERDLEGVTNATFEID
ncbi:protein unc-93 homolog A-like [Amphiura filiformis]|uniref:protein unc-93 homolog A-like n=1 Tax=Amphiura filiformis TaxID=82378 RepID=UPI003B211E5B